METVRVRWVISLLVLSAGLARADEPELRQLPDIAAQAMPARDIWERCLATSVRPELSSKRKSDDIADLALLKCAQQQKRVQAVLARGIGRKRAETVINELRRMQRDSLMLVVDELRRR
jgi:hypothetical protein